MGKHRAAQVLKTVGGADGTVEPVATGTVRLVHRISR
jgi:hypothetical protein